MWAGDLIGPTGSPGIWEPWRERGHVTSTHHQLSQILLAQLAGSGVISQFPKVPREISSPAGPSSKRTGDRFTGWSGLLGSDKEPKLRPPSTPTHITSDEINLHHWIRPTTNTKTTSEMELVRSIYNYSRERNAIIPSQTSAKTDKMHFSNLQNKKELVTSLTFTFLFSLLLWNARDDCSQMFWQVSTHFCDANSAVMGNFAFARKIKD